MIELEVWNSNPKKPGYVKFERTRTIKEIYDELVPKLKKITFDYENEKISLYDAMDYFNPENKYPKRETFERGHRWIACYAVTGSNEGHYIHIDLIYQNKVEPIDMIFMGKTFLGWDIACKIAKECGRLLGA